MPPIENPKHERFAQELAKGRSQSEAYANAGYPAKGDAARTGASRLLTNANVAARLSELQERGAIKTEITLQSLIEEAAEIQASALKEGQHSAAVSALTAKAKLAGLWIERSETENTNTNYVVSSDPVDSIEDWEAEHAPKH